MSCFDLDSYAYITDDAPAPDTVNPSLWRQSQVMRRAGLYKVVDGLYQVRNNDIGDLTIVEARSDLGAPLDLTEALPSVIWLGSRTGR